MSCKEKENVLALFCLQQGSFEESMMTMLSVSPIHLPRNPTNIQRCQKFVRPENKIGFHLQFFFIIISVWFVTVVMS